MPRNRIVTFTDFIVAVICITFVAICASQYSEIQALQHRVDGLDKQIAWFQKETRAQISMLAAQPASVPVVQPEPVDHTVKLAEVQAQAEADREALAQKLRLTQQSQQQLKAELNRVRAATTSTNAQLVAVTNEVGNVKSELATRESKINQSIADLKHTVGDLGIQTAAVAKNKKELDGLKALGDRSYFDFDINRPNASRRISDVTITVKKVDPKRNRFTIELVSEDRRVEKKDRTLNEPIQFYVTKAMPPYGKVESLLYEIVVNEVKKDQIIGYLTTPRLDQNALAAAR